MDMGGDGDKKLSIALDPVSLVKSSGLVIGLGLQAFIIKPINGGLNLSIDLPA